MEKRKEKSDPKLRELKRWTKVKLNSSITFLKENWYKCESEILEFINIDWVYARWKCWEEIIIMGHSNQKISEYGEIID